MSDVLYLHLVQKYAVAEGMELEAFKRQLQERPITASQRADGFGLDGMSVSNVSAIESGLSPSPGTPGEGWGGGLVATDRVTSREPAPTLTLPRSTGRGDKRACDHRASDVGTKPICSPPSTPHRTASLLLVSIVLLLTGCETVVEDPRPQPLIRANGRIQNERPQQITGPLSPDVIAATDPCAMRMHDIEGLIIEYFAIHQHQMPARLEDVRPLAQVDVDTSFTCPETGKPYVYILPGLSNPAQTHRMILFDAAPHKDGKRFVIIMDEPKGRDLIMRVDQLTEAQFKIYASPQP